jgi:hypothetical protein
MGHCNRTDQNVFCGFHLTAELELLQIYFWPTITGLKGSSSTSSRNVSWYIVNFNGMR